LRCNPDEEQAGKQAQGANQTTWFHGILLKYGLTFYTARLLKMYAWNER
jgi:hypothetical protein